MIQLVPCMTWILWSTWATWPFDHRGSIIPAPFAEDICEPGPLSSIPFLLLLKLQCVQIGWRLCNTVHVFFATPCGLDLDSRCDLLLELFEILKWYNCRISCHTIANCTGQANVAASCEWNPAVTQSVVGYLVPRRFQACKCLWFAILYCYPAVISHGTDWTEPFIMDTLW